MLAWLSRPLEGEEVESGDFPVLNRILGSKLLEAAKGSRFGVDFQALQESSVRQQKQVQGHLLLGRICCKICLDKERGMSLSQQHLLALKPQGVEIKDLEEFLDRVEFVLSSLETTEYPSEPILRTWLYECLKNVPKLALKIDRFKEAPAGDSKRSFQWLWQSMIDSIDESQHDHNTASVPSALRSKVDAASAQAEKNEKKERKDDEVPICPPKSPDEKSEGYEPSLALDEGDPKPLEEGPEADVGDTLLDHSILHLPKRAGCPICQEAKQDALRVQEL